MDPKVKNKNIRYLMSENIKTQNYHAIDKNSSRDF